MRGFRCRERRVSAALGCRAQTAISVYFPFVALLSSRRRLGSGPTGLSQAPSARHAVGLRVVPGLLLHPDPAALPGIRRLSTGRRIGELLDTPTSNRRPRTQPVSSRLAGDIRTDRVGFATARRATGPRRHGRRRPAHPGRHHRRRCRFHRRRQVGPGEADRPVLRRHRRCGAGGSHIRDFDLPGYRQRLGVVPQEPHLFSGTVRDNIAYGRPDATDAEVEGAARSARCDRRHLRADRWIHPPGRRTGPEPVAGQRQLVSLARANWSTPTSCRWTRRPPRRSIRRRRNCARRH